MCDPSRKTEKQKSKKLKNSTKIRTPDLRVEEKGKHKIDPNASSVRNKITTFCKQFLKDSNRGPSGTRTKNNDFWFKRFLKGCELADVAVSNKRNKKNNRTGSGSTLGV